jgi:hypothetical protein
MAEYRLSPSGYIGNRRFQAYFAGAHTALWESFYNKAHAIA